MYLEVHKKMFTIICIIAALGVFFLIIGKGAGKTVAQVENVSKTAVRTTASGARTAARTAKSGSKTAVHTAASGGKTAINKTAHAAPVAAAKAVNGGSAVVEKA